jgi:bacillithiol biosynthesis cysteine-adding enzyme BshC
MKLQEEIKLTDTGILPALVQDYLKGEESIRTLFKYTPALSSFQQVIADKQKGNTNRQLLVEVLQAQYADISTTEQVQLNIQSLLSANTFTVTAAHQPCLFMGPLYNIYKIAGAVNLSVQLKKQYPAYHFVPVFWMGSEDHDMDELNNTFVNGKKIQWTAPSSGAIGRVPSSVVAACVEELKQTVAETEIVSILEKGLAQYSTFGKLTQYFVNELFKEFGLVVLNQDDAKLKSLFSNVIADEVLEQRAMGVLKDTLQLLETNYKVQAAPRHINFFYLGDGYRERIVYDAESKSYQVNNTSVSFTVAELKAEIENHPGRFSPNVIYRPLYQEMVLPNLAFIGGSAELSYWMQLKPLFDYHRVNYPALVMRNSAAVLNASTQNKLQKLNLKVSDFFTEVEELIKKYVKENATVDTSLEPEKQQLEKLFDAVADKAALADVTLKQSAATEKQKALNALATLEAKMLKAEKRHQEVAVTQIRSVHAHLFPQGSLQERVENFIPFYIPTFITEMVQALNPFDGGFKVFVVGE